MDKELLEITGRFPGQVGLVAEDLVSGERFSLEAAEVFPAASTMKLFVLGAILEAGADLTEQLPLLASELASGSGVLKDLTVGSLYSLRDLLTLMITVSDNTATNLLLERFGFPFFQDYLGRHGFSQTRIERKLSHPGSADWTGANLTSPADLAGFLRGLWSGQLLGEPARSLALDILRRQHYLNLIQALPVDGDQIEDGEDPLVVYSKSGSLRRARHDCGILVRGNRSTLLAVMSRADLDLSFNSVNPGAQLLWEVGAWAYRRWLS